MPFLARLLRVDRGVPSVSSVARQVTLQWTALERIELQTREEQVATTMGDRDIFRSSVLILLGERGVHHNS